jgi:hypothetical protein
VRGAPSFTVRKDGKILVAKIVEKGEASDVTQKIVTCVSSYKRATKAMVHNN